jgi:hypothetical protein
VRGSILAKLFDGCAIDAVSTWEQGCKLFKEGTFYNIVFFVSLSLLDRCWLVAPLLLRAALAAGSLARCPRSTMRC